MPLHKPASGVGELRTEYSCRLREPEEFQKKSFRRISSGDVDLVIARPHGMKKTRAQAIRYPRELWDEKDAKRSCKKRHGTFEPVNKLGQVENDDEYTEAYTKLVHLYNATNDQDALDLMEIAENAMAAGVSYMFNWKSWLEQANKLLATQKPQRKPRTDGKTRLQPLPPDAQSVQDLSFNSDKFTCYGKPTGRGFRAYCRRKEK